MIVRAVTVWVKSPFVHEFERATLENHRQSLSEPGVLRFDVLKSDEEPGRYLLYEVYRSDEAVEAHKRTDHYHQWRNAVEPWMEKPRKGDAYAVIAPPGPDAWRSTSQSR